MKRAANPLGRSARLKDGLLCFFDHGALVGATAATGVSFRLPPLSGIKRSWYRGLEAKSLLEKLRAIQQLPPAGGDRKFNRRYWRKFGV